MQFIISEINARYSKNRIEKQTLEKVRLGVRCNKNGRKENPSSGLMRDTSGWVFFGAHNFNNGWHNPSKCSWDCHSLFSLLSTTLIMPCLIFVYEMCMPHSLLASPPPLVYLFSSLLFLSKPRYTDTLSFNFCNVIYKIKLSAQISWL